MQHTTLRNRRETVKNEAVIGGYGMGLARKRRN